MRILHVGFGFRPWIVNGLVIYCEDLTEGQAKDGHEVGYFFAGRQLPLVRRPFVYRWRRRDVRMFEWINSTLVAGRHRGSPQPLRDLADQPTEAAFRGVLRRFCPEVVHVHDLGGLPSSIIDVSHRRGLPVVMTLHDYQSLCPTIKLYDADEHVCSRLHPGQTCVRCCANAPLDNREDLERTRWYTRMRIRTSVPHLDSALRGPAGARVQAAGTRLAQRVPRSRQVHPSGTSPRAPIGPPLRSAAAYDQRREQNVSRLNRVEALIAFSTRSAEVYRRLGVEQERIRVLRMNPAHVEQLRPKPSHRSGAPLRFAALNACNSTPKGADLIMDALKLLSARQMDDRFRLSVRGWIAPHAYPALAAHPSVELDGDYRTEELDGLLDDVDVGLVPSVWEEVYGFVGVEFLAKGIPVIGNARGGIPEYVRPGETGWLNHSASATELADLMIEAIEDPGEVRRLGARAVELREELITSSANQRAETYGIYGEAIRRVAGTW